MLIFLFIGGNILLLFYFLLTVLLYLPRYFLQKTLRLAHYDTNLEVMRRLQSYSGRIDSRKFSRQNIHFELSSFSMEIRQEIY